MASPKKTNKQTKRTHKKKHTNFSPHTHTNQQQNKQTKLKYSVNETREDKLSYNS